MKTQQLKAPILAFLASIALSLPLSGGCSEDLPSDTSSSSSSGGGGKTTGSTGSTGGAGGGGPGCVANPMTHLEIINACTDAQQIDVSPVLPLLLPDGTLPPLP